MRNTRRRVKKEDFARVLLTETSTYDAPLIFSNLGFYWHWKKFEENKSLFPELIEKLFIQSDTKSYTIPYSFKIRKDETSYRHLSLMHPRSQVSFINFYKIFDSQILAACQDGEFSVRKPAKVASKYYAKNSEPLRSKYRAAKVAASANELRTKYLTSYFAYESHTRLYSYFESGDFRSLEKKFTTFWSVDIARCFDSVYTHSITWALKEKSYAKTHRNVENSFGAIFDRLMQSSNYNETSGILIGSEVSRIFAEIILQQVDQAASNLLELKGLIHNKDYAVRRYVDDILIFTNGDGNAQIIISALNDALKEYKFSLNSGKTKRFDRPFITHQSRAIAFAKLSYKNFLEKLFEKDETTAFAPKKPRFLFNRRRVLTSFLSELKAGCPVGTDSYIVVAGYILAVAANLLVGFIDTNQNYEFTDDKEKSRYREVIFILIDLIFHLYTIHPTPGSSIKIGILINRVWTYFQTNLPDDLNAASSLIYVLSNEFLDSGNFEYSAKDNDSTSTLEVLNLISAIKILGGNFCLSQQALSKVIGQDSKRTLSYFEIITLLYYIGDDKHGMYRGMKQRLIKNIRLKLSNLNDIKESSEKMHLLLDVLACPFLEKKVQQDLIRRLYACVELCIPDDSGIDNLREEFQRFQWFTSWKSADFVNNLEKKALLRAY